MILRFPALFIGAYPTGTVATILGVIFAAPAAWLMLFAAGIVGGLDDELERGGSCARRHQQGPRCP